jgi:hypothetical protein
LLRGTPCREARSGSAGPSILMLGFVQCKALNCKRAAATKFVAQDPIPCTTKCMRGSGWMIFCRPGWVVFFIGKLGRSSLAWTRAARPPVPRGTNEDWPKAEAPCTARTELQPAVGTNVRCGGFRLNGHVAVQPTSAFQKGR